MLYSSDELLALLQKQMRGEPLSQDEAISIWSEMHGVMASIPGGRMLSCIYDHLTRELGVGDRCGVCGRYKSKDCWEDC